MAYSNSLSKPNALIFNLQARLSTRYPTYTLTTGTDANGYPALLVQQSASIQTGQNNALISVTPVTSTQTNLIGGTEDFNAGPLYANLCLENSSTTGVPVVTGAFSQVVQYEVGVLQTIQALYLVNNAVTLSFAGINAQITASNLIQQFLPEPLTGQLVAS